MCQDAQALYDITRRQLIASGEALEEMIQQSRQKPPSELLDLLKEVLGVDPEELVEVPGLGFVLRMGVSKDDTNDDKPIH